MAELAGPTPLGEGLVDIKVAAAFLGVTVRWMRRRKDSREIPYYKLGRRLAFNPADLRRIWNTARVESRQLTETRDQGPPGDEPPFAAEKSDDA